VTNLSSSAYIYNYQQPIGLRLRGAVTGDLLNSSGTINASAEMNLDTISINGGSTSTAWLGLYQYVTGISLGGSIGGDLDNSGTITATASINATGVSVNAGTSAYGSASVQASGIRFNGNTVSGTAGLINSGTISATANFDTSGIVLAGTTSSTNVAVTAIGVNLGTGSVAAIDNSGTIMGVWTGGNTTAATPTTNYYGAGIVIGTGSNVAGGINNSGLIKGSNDGLAIGDIGGGTFSVTNEGTFYGGANAITTTNGTLDIDGTGFLTGDLNGGTTTTLNIVGDQTVDGDITDFASPVTIKATTGALRTFDTTVNTDVTFEADTLFSGTLNVDPTLSNFNVTGAVTSPATMTLVVDASNGTVLADGATHIIIENDSDNIGAEVSAIVVPTADVIDNNIGFNFTASLDADGDLQVTTALETNLDIVIPDGEILYSNQDFDFDSVTIGDPDADGNSGTLIQQGGTLDIADGVAVNGDSAFTQTDTGVLNTPTITIGDSGVVTLQNQNTEGTIAIDGATDGVGELVFTGEWDTDAAIGGTSSLAKVTVTDTGALTLDENLDATTILVEGTVTQTAGTLTAGSNTLIVAAGASFTQSADGVLNSPTVVIGDLGTVTLVNQNTEGTVAFDGANAGEGLLVFGGDWDLDAAIGATASLDTVTVNEGATLTIDQVVNATNLSIAGAVTKASADAITANTVIADGASMLVSSSYAHNGNLTVGGGASGSLDVTNTTVSVTGDFVLDAGTTFGTVINSATQDDAGKVVATGNVTVSADSTIDVTVESFSGIADGVTYKIIEGSAGSVALPTVTDSSTKVEFVASTAGSDLTLTTEIASITDWFSDLTPNATAVVGVLDDVFPADGELLGALLDIEDQGEFQDAVESLAPDMSAAVMSVGNSANRQAVGTVIKRLNDLRVANGDNRAMSGMAAGDSNNGMSAWLQGFASTFDQNDRQNIDGFDGDTTGFSLGVDSLVKDNLRLGLAFSYVDTDVDTNNSGNRTEIETYQATLYGNFANGPHVVDASLSYGSNDYEGTRRINVGALSRVARADYDGDQVTWQANYRYQMEISDEVIISPYAGLYYVGFDMDGYTETGAGATNLRVRKQDYKTFETVLGVSIHKSFEMSNGFVAVPELHASFRQEYVDDAQQNTSTFTGGGASFSTNGFDPANSSVNVGGSLTMYSSENFDFKAGYDFQSRKGFKGHSGTVNIHYSF